MKKTYAVSFFTVLTAALLSPQCSTGVEPSPSPGIVRVTIKANDLDTLIVIRSDTTRFSRWDSFVLLIARGLLYSGDNYAYLYRDKSNTRINSDTVNIIARQWLNGVPITYLDTATITAGNSRYIKHIIFESYVPPGDYDRLEMTLTGTEVDTYIPVLYQNPISLPDSASPVIGFYQPYSVRENGITEINLEIDPFASLQRYRDFYVFSRKMRVVSVNQL